MKLARQKTGLRLRFGSSRPAPVILFDRGHTGAGQELEC
jgi:hypothetical protein